MARTDPRGGPETRDRIATVASGLFAQHGFDAVTVAQIARAAGVSGVTVFKHFPKKEDLFFDRDQDAAELLRRAVHDGAAHGGVLGALRDLALELLEQRHPFSGVDPRSVAFFRTVAQSATLIARARQIAADLADVLAEELRATAFDGDPALVATLFTAGYARILTDTAADLIHRDEPADALARRHRDRIGRLFAALEHGVLTHPR